MELDSSGFELIRFERPILSYYLSDFGNNGNHTEGWRPLAVAVRTLGRYHAGKLIMTVFGGITEFERDLIRERTSAGRQAAERREIHCGRPRERLSPEQPKSWRRGSPIAP